MFQQCYQIVNKKMFEGCFDFVRKSYWHWYFRAQAMPCFMHQQFMLCRSEKGFI